MSIEQTKKIVIEGYREILKREPDPSGFRHYVSQLSLGRISKKRFLEILRTSKEYKRKFSGIDKNKNSITFFVFIGEFGYEILSSHGWLRLLKSKYPNFKIGIASRGGVEFLYEDGCDIYVDITDILIKYISESFGVNISNEDKQKIHKRCSDVCKGYIINIIYSNQRYFKNGIEYCTGHVRDHNSLQKQRFKLLTLSKYQKEKDFIIGKFPELSTKKYVVLHDRRRDRSWGRTKVGEDIWKYIINRLIKSDYLVVLIGYRPYKNKDAYSIFYKDDFKKILGTINISDFLNDNINNNILYQALIIQNAQFYLGIWGSAGYLPPLLGVDSYLLSLGRKNFGQIKNETSLWNKFLSVGKGHLYCMNTTTEKKSIIDALDRVNMK